MPKILTFKPNWKKKKYNESAGRWCKQIDGIVHYFGTGQSKNDIKAYKQAEQSYFSYVVKNPQKRPVKKPADKMTVLDVCNMFMKSKHASHEGGGLSSQYVGKLKIALAGFIQFYGKQTLMHDFVEYELERYKNHLYSFPKSHLTGKPITLETAKGYLRCVKTMLRWAWKMRLINDLPRNLEDFIKTPDKRSAKNVTPKIFNIEELAILWNTATDRTKLYLALALNCGQTQKDISDLIINEVDVEDGYIKRNRSKTGVYAEHKLWDVTIELIKKHRHIYTDTTNGSESLFLTQKKTSGEYQTLLRQPLDANCRVKKSDVIRNSFFRLLKATGISERGFRALRKTGSSIIEKIDPMATSMFLSHSEPGMKKHYAQRDWGRLERALLEMEKQLSHIFYS